MTEPLVLMCCCPACATLFEVANVQLEQHAGLVRCGECERVFNATWHLVDEPGSASPQPIVRTEISPLNQDIDAAALTTIRDTLADEPLAELRRSDDRPLPRPKPMAAVQSPRRSEPHLSRLPSEHEQRLGEETVVAVTTARKKKSVQLDHGQFLGTGQHILRGRVLPAGPSFILQRTGSDSCDAPGIINTLRIHRLHRT